MDYQVQTELQNVETAYSGSDLTAALTNVSFKARKLMVEAARIITPADPLVTIQSQHSTVTTNANTNNKANAGWAGVLG